MEPGIIRRVLLVLVLSGFVGCSTLQRKPTIGIDGWWDVDYAKSACFQSAQSGHPCLDDPSAMAYGVEKDFVSAFQENPACAGVTIVNDFHDPDKDSLTSKINSAKWDLSFNVAVEEGELKSDSQWQIIDNATGNRYADGDLRNFSQASTKVCTVVKGTGGVLK